MEVDVLENNQDWTSSTAENARQLFFKAAMLLDPEWIEQNISDDLNQNVLKLHSVRHHFFSFKFEHLL